MGLSSPPQSSSSATLWEGLVPRLGVHGLLLFCRFAVSVLLVLLALDFALLLLSLLLVFAFLVPRLGVHDLLLFCRFAVSVLLVLLVFDFALLLLSLLLVFALLVFFHSFALRLCVGLLGHGLLVLLPTVGCCFEEHLFCFSQERSDLPWKSRHRFAVLPLCQDCVSPPVQPTCRRFYL